MKKIMAASAVTTTLLLTGCSTAVGDAEAPAITGVGDVRNALAGTTYECDKWKEHSDNMASCTSEGTTNGQSRQVAHIVNDGELMAAVTLDGDRNVPGVVWGDGWAVTCHRRLNADECSDIADILGGEMMKAGGAVAP